MNVKLTPMNNESDNENQDNENTDDKPEVALNYRQRRKVAHNLKNVAQGIRKHRDFSRKIQDGDTVMLKYDQIMKRIEDNPDDINKEYIAFVKNSKDKEFTAVKSDVEIEHRNLFSLKEASKAWLFIETDLIKVVECE